MPLFGISGFFGQSEKTRRSTAAHHRPIGRPTLQDARVLSRFGQVGEPGTFVQVTVQGSFGDCVVDLGRSAGLLIVDHHLEGDAPD